MLQPRSQVIRLLRRHTPKPSQHRNSSTESTTSHKAHTHPPPANESLGRSFYITLAAIPLSFALYKLATSTSADGETQPFLTRLISKWSQYHEQNVARNALHTKMVEQAALDRNLFQSSPGSKMIDLKFPEVFNTGSPYNVPAGHSTDLSYLIKHYEDRNREIADRAARKREPPAGGAEQES